jgi:hypothetical protein
MLRLAFEKTIEYFRVVIQGNVNDVSLNSKSLTLPLKSLLSAFGEINPDSRH